MADETIVNGKIVTFYSFKGGTGRTMALANVAWILASNGLKVLVVDWDLDSPGLHRYFHPFLDPPKVATRLLPLDGSAADQQLYNRIMLHVEGAIHGIEDLYGDGTNLLPFGQMLQVNIHWWR